MCRGAHHVRDVLQVCELVEADGEMTQRGQAGDLLQLTQTVAMEI